MHRLLLFLLALSLASCSLVQTAPPQTKHAPLSQLPQNKVHLLVFSHGLHTGVALPRKLFRHQFTELGSNDADFLEFGWGDEGFYRSEKITFTLAARAIFHPTPGVMHVVAVSHPPHQFYQDSKLRAIPVHQKKAQEIATWIESNFTPGDHANLIDLGPGRYGQSRFYRSNDRYFFPRTCNSWTAKVLNKIGCDGNAVTAPKVFRNLDRYLSNDSARSYRDLPH